MVLRYTTLVPSMELHIGPACEPGISAGMRRERVQPTRESKQEGGSMAKLLSVCEQCMTS